MLILQILGVLIGICGIGYSANRIVFYGKKTEIGELGNVLLWLIAAVISAIILAVSVVFLFIV